MPEFMDQDRIYLDLDNDRIEWMYYNPDSVSEGQFVTNVFDRARLEEALEGIPSGTGISTSIYLSSS